MYQKTVLRIIPRLSKAQTAVEYSGTCKSKVKCTCKIQTVGTIMVKFLLV